MEARRYLVKIFVKGFVTLEYCKGFTKIFEEMQTNKYEVTLLLQDLIK